MFSKNRKGEIVGLVGTVKRSEIAQYYTVDYLKMDTLFYRFKNGFGLPGGKSWDQQPDHILRAIDIIESQYNIARGD